MPTPYLASPSDLALRTGLPDTDPKLLQALTRASSRFRDAVGHEVSVVLDDEVDLSGDGTTILHLLARPIIGTPTVTIGGSAVADFQTGRRSGMLRRMGGWAEGLENISVTYSHGYAQIPEGISNAVLEAAEANMNIMTGIESISTGDESVKLSAVLAGGGATPAWTEAVARYEVGKGDHS